MNERIKNLIDKILIFPSSFLLIIVLYIWFATIINGPNNLIPSLNVLLTNIIWVFILSIILSISLIFIEKKFLINKKVIKN
jgi:hypothetical protein